MGTNYYLESRATLPLVFGRPRIHIGKSSGGWCFSLHVYPDSDIGRPADLEQWAILMDGAVANGSALIIAETGTVLTVSEMLEMITVRSWDRKMVYPNSHYASESEFHRLNHSEPGPNGLVRHKIDGTHCIGHGSGTWDLIIGDFS